MIRTLVAAAVLAFTAAPAAAQHVTSSASGSTSGGGMCGPVCCDNCGGNLPTEGGPVQVPAPPAAMLFAAAAMALVARSRRVPTDRA